MKPTDKLDSIDKFIKGVFGVDRKKTIRENKCIFCDEPDLEFTDTRSRVEYTISGMCQRCQNNTF